MNRRIIALILLLNGFSGCQVMEDKTAKNTAINSDNKRIKTYYAVATQLALLSDQALFELLEKETSVRVGTGGTKTSLMIGGTRIFIKKIRLTDIERKPENIRSTKNVFELPLYYQYGIGSTGFGVWRELFVHILSTNWVLTGECQNFPMMYHWRVLPRSSVSQQAASEALKNLEDSVKHWGGSPAIRTRLEAIQNASAEIVIFLEYIPDTLNQWLENKFAEDGATAEKALAMVENNINSITSFMNAYGLLHFDAHFGNILTDGHRLYWTDFGLAICSQFELSEAESNFFNNHRNYDRYLMITDLVRTIISSLFEKDLRKTVLHEYATGKGDKIKAAWAAAVVRRYASIASVMLDFRRQLSKNKATPFPHTELERADKKSMQYHERWSSF